MLLLTTSVLVAGMSDFNYLHTNCMEITVELGCDKYPTEAELYPEWKRNKEALLSFMESVSVCVRGQQVLVWFSGVTETSLPLPGPSGD